MSTLGSSSGLSGSLPTTPADCVPCETKAKQSPAPTFGCGLSVGLVTTGLLTPWDRALFLSVSNKRPFLSAENFRNPYYGVGQALVQRSLSGGLYFPLEELGTRLAYEHLAVSSSSAAHFWGGTASGAVSAIVLNPLSAVRYQIWGSPKSGFFDMTAKMWRKGGVMPFTRGLPATLTRDIVFGAVYSSLRNHVEVSSTAASFVINLASSLVACCASAPFNFARNVQYSVKPGQEGPTMIEALASLAREARSSDNPLSLFRERLNIGWGALRVGVGMALGSQLYSSCTAFKARMACRDEQATDT